MCTNGYVEIENNFEDEKERKGKKKGRNYHTIYKYKYVYQLANEISTAIIRRN